MRETVACIIPVFNGERFLPFAIDSVLAQTHRDIEIFVVDDGSTDGTGQVVSGYGERVRYTRQQNAGANRARNAGVRLTKGQYVAFLDADDLWVGHKIERQLSRFRARPELDVSVGMMENFWEQEAATALDRDQLRDHPRLKPLMAYSAGTVLIRRSCFDRVGVFDEELRHMDIIDWFSRAREAGIVIEEVPEVLLQRRLHSRNESRRSASESFDECFDLLKRRIDRSRSRRGGTDAPPPS